MNSGFPDLRVPGLEWLQPYSSDLDEATVDRVAHDLNSCLNEIDNDFPFFKANFMLNRISRKDRKRVVTKTVDGKPALFKACKQRGQLQFVKYFLDECGADVEQRGVYELREDSSTHKATPLWVAALSGNIEIIKVLLEHGADVNAESDMHSTPVRAACFMSKLEAVRLLFERGGDIYKSNVNGGTCLMNSLRNPWLCRFLLERNVHVNAQDNYGNSALHYAVGEERTDTVEVLLKRGADVYLKNCIGDDAYRTAALHGYTDLLDLLTQHSQPSITSQIESHEIMGTYFVDDKDEIEKAMHHWRTAILMRQQHNMMLSSEDTKHPLPPYSKHAEVTTVEQLAEIEVSPDRVYMQSLMVRERVLGPDHKKTVFCLMQRGAFYATSYRYQRCVDLWKHAYNLRRKNEYVTQEGLYALQALCKLLLEIDEKHAAGLTSEAVGYDDVSSIFHSICDDVETVFLTRKNSVLQATSKEDFHIMVLLLLHVIHLLDRIATGPDDIVAFWRRLHQLMRRKVRLMSDDRSLLHLAMDEKTSYVEGKLYSKFPNTQVVKLLVGCRADVNAIDDTKNTPLHICSKRALEESSDPNEKAQTTKLAEVIIARGAHMDARNKHGQLASDGLRNLPLKLRPPLSYVTLKCLAARVIQRYKIAYEGEVPVALNSFIALH